MGTLSIWHWVIVLVVVVILFGGRGKLSSLMGDMAKGVTAFKKGLKDDGSGDGDEPIEPLAAQSATTVEGRAKKDETAST